MLDIIPNKEELVSLVGTSLYDVWKEFSTIIEKHYDMNFFCFLGGKLWKYEKKYSRGGKTLCALYARKNCIGFMVIFGKKERLKFEETKEQWSKEIQEQYDASQTYHDGKWMMFELTDASLFDDFISLLKIKRKPNRK